MSISILICDDSSFARKQVLKALPSDWQTNVFQATNGSEAVQMIPEKNIELLFLDLTMPIMDGYEVLDHLKKTDTNCFVIVISGDIQPDAVERVKKLGAIGFIKKPVNKEEIETLLVEFGLLVRQPL